MISLQQLLKACVNKNASDLHIVAGSPPLLRIHRELVRLKAKSLSGEEVRQLCYSIIDEGQRSYLEEHKEMDFSFGVRGVSRFRVNYFFQRGQISAAFRRIPLKVPGLMELKLPNLVKSLVGFPNGLVLITGPAGSGKSTTLASIVSLINEERRGHIITLEDPIEYVHEHKGCIVSQREINSDTESFQTGLKYILRQDPDVCLLGELRDIVSMKAALDIAETGHLVFATLHTNSAVQTLNRVLSMFPESEYMRVCSQLASVLSAVLSQRLLAGVNGEVFPACEFLAMTTGVRNLIREGKMHQIYGIMQLGQEKSEMLTMNQSLVDLISRKKIAIETGFKTSSDPSELDSLLKRVGM